MAMNIEDTVRRADRVKAERGTWESHWQELADYCLPTKATVTHAKTPGTKLGTTLYDSTAQQSVLVYAAGLHSYLTNPSARWFELALNNRALMMAAEVRSWLKEVEEEIFFILNNSNFNHQIHEGYIDFAVFGHANIYEEQDEEDIVRFYTRPVSEICLAENIKGRVDTIFRFFSLSARQARQMWDDPGQKARELINANKPDDEVSYLQAIMPREERLAGKLDSVNKPYASYYIEPKTKKLLSEGGYDEFPFFCPRCYKTSNSPYAYSPSAVALPDIKTLNSMSKTILKAGQKMLNPPIVLPDDGFLMPFKLTEGGVNVRLPGAGVSEGKVETIDVKPNIPVGLDLENQRRESIRRAYFVDLFLMLADQPRMTATEVRERVNEKMLILGPTLGRLMSELLNPIIIRTFNILLREGRLPPMPEILAGQRYKIEYISPLAKAQRMTEAQSIDTFLAEVRAIAEMSPDVIDNVNLDRAAQKLNDIYNVPGDILRSDSEIRQIRQQRAQAQQQQREFAEIVEGTGAAQKAAQAVKDLRDDTRPRA